MPRGLNVGGGFSNELPTCLLVPVEQTGLYMYDTGLTAELEGHFLRVSKPTGTHLCGCHLAA
jgi:hypothetical protein